jgi:hypothetical protein
VVGIGEEGEREAVLLPELDVGGLRVGADSEDGRAALLDLAVDVPQATCLRGTARSVVLGIEVEDDGAAAEIGQAHALAAVAGELEVGRLLSFLDHEREL